MTTQIHKCHPRDTEEQIYDVRLHDVELHDVANVCHKSASSCVPNWLPFFLYQCKKKLIFTFGQKGGGGRGSQPIQKILIRKYSDLFTIFDYFWPFLTIFYHF